ncbi:MAG: hypothetical protein LBI60_03935 [Bacteroidales bacterium]|jgi:hypothetical protein|nr:hypothetical protein [Bacteroidales bacterium]
MTIDNEYQWFVKNHDRLAKEYKGKWLIIKDETVTDSFEDETEAVHYAAKNYEAGTYIIQLCASKLEDLTQHFHSRAKFV